MKIRTLIGLTALGGAYYLHRKRGGELTLDSVKDSLRALRDNVDHMMKSGPSIRDRDLQSDVASFEAEIIESMPDDQPFKGGR
jgi:hypothetical protein